jgi:hypothetical protein
MKRMRGGGISIMSRTGRRGGEEGKVRVLGVSQRDDNIFAENRRARGGGGFAGVKRVVKSTRIWWWAWFHDDEEKRKSGRGDVLADG